MSKLRTTIYNSDSEWESFQEHFAEDSIIRYIKLGDSGTLNDYSTFMIVGYESYAIIVRVFVIDDYIGVDKKYTVREIEEVFVDKNEIKLRMLDI
jgi:hypothetical protein